MALSGRKRSLMYFALAVTAYSTASSVYVTLWNASYRGSRPRIIFTVSSVDGSSMSICWNLRIMPCDLEKYLLNSSYVVLPMKRMSPFSMYGFRMFEASSEPSIFPAPTMLCISSMYMIGAENFEAPSITSLRRFSKSPRYCVPATMVPMSIMNILLSRSLSGTSPLLMRAARP